MYQKDVLKAVNKWEGFSMLVRAKTKSYRKFPLLAFYPKALSGN